MSTGQSKVKFTSKNWNGSGRPPLLRTEKKEKDLNSTEMRFPLQKLNSEESADKAMSMCGRLLAFNSHLRYCAGSDDSEAHNVPQSNPHLV